MQLLNQAVVICDERLTTENLGPAVKEIVLKISPDYSYTKFLSKNSDEAFWGKKFTQNILSDVRNRVFPASVAASSLGVTAEMVFFALNQNGSGNVKFNDNNNITDIIAVNDYVYSGYGSKDQFWKEQSILALLADVKNRNVSVEEVASLIGVARKEVLDRCGGIKSKEEREAEIILEENNKLQQRAHERSIYVKKKSQLEIQIEMAEKSLEELSEYEKMRLKNMKERQELLNILDVDKEKRELKALTPQNTRKVYEVVPLREKSARIKRRSQLKQLKDMRESPECSSFEWRRIQKSRLSPKWFGQWVPRMRQNQKLSKHLLNKYDEEAVAEANHVPKCKLKSKELLEINPAYHKSGVLMDSFTADFGYMEIEEHQPMANKSIEWNKVKLVQDSMVSTRVITSIDSCSDFVCFGTDTGSVGVTMDGRAFIIRPHNRQVTRTIFTGSNASLGILSAAKDGTVRLFDLAKQSVSLQYSWDHFGTCRKKIGVNWLEVRSEQTFLLDCEDEINMIDTRVGKTVPMFSVSNIFGTCNITNLSVNNNLMSLCRENCVQIWDLRKTDEPMTNISGPGDTIMAGAGWSRSSSCFYASVRHVGVKWGKGGAKSDKTLVFQADDYSQPTLSWVGPRKTDFVPYSGVSWCPWDDMFLITMEQGTNDWKCGVAVIDSVSGRIVWELTEGLYNTRYLVHCSQSRQMVMVANSRGPGGLAVFKVEE